jgi:hypothetical protein
LSDLYAPIFVHFSIGLALAFAAWVVGFASLLAVGVPSIRISREAGTFAFPVGLLLLLATAFAVDLGHAIGAAIAASVAALAVVGVCRDVGVLRRLARLWMRPFLFSLPFVCIFALVLGSTWAPPSATRGAVGDKDFLWYVGRAVAAQDSVLPIHNLNVLGDSGRLLNAGPELLAGALAGLPGFEPFLFFGVSLPVFALSSYAIGLPLLLNDPAELRARPLLLAGMSVLLADGLAANTVSYLVASPPAALLMPAVFALAALVVGPPLPVRALAPLTFVLTLVALETKTIALFAVAAVVVVAFKRSGPPLRALVSVTAPAVVACVAGVAVLAQNSSWQLRWFMQPEFQPRTLVSEITADASITSPVWWKEGATGIIWLGTLLISIALLVRGRPLFALALTVATVVTATVIHSEFFINLNVALSLIALGVWRCGSSFASPPLLLGGAFVVAVGAAFGDSAMNPRASWVAFSAISVAVSECAVASLWTGRRAHAYAVAAAAVGVALGTLAVAGALVAAPFLAAAFGAGLAASARLPRRKATASAAVVAVATVGCAAATARAISRDHFHLYTGSNQVTADDYLVWRRVASSTPPDALIFTDFGGLPDEGFVYPSLAKRQLYVGGWVYSSLWLDATARNQRLAINHRVIAGDRAPNSVPGAEKYRSFFAVVGRDTHMPRIARPIYRNRTWALYQLQPDAPG